jgi:hypothetical protein
VIYLGVVLNESADVGRPSLMATLRRAERRPGDEPSARDNFRDLDNHNVNDPFGGLGCDRTGPRGRQCREQIRWWKSLVLNVIYF